MYWIFLVYNMGGWGMRRRKLLGPFILTMTIVLLTTVGVYSQKTKIVFFNWYATPSANQVELTSSKRLRDLTHILRSRNKFSPELR